MELDEPIEIVDYDPRWPDLFAVGRERIQQALSEPAIAIEHIGSTAIVGLAGKPVVDLMIGVTARLDSRSLQETLGTLGYECLGEAGVPGRTYFRMRTGQHFNAHAISPSSAHWRNNLLVRDFLRAHPARSAEYAEQKRKAFASGARSLLKYSEEKRAFLADLLLSASTWELSPN